MVVPASKSGPTSTCVALPARGQGEDAQFVGDQRVHPIDADELFRESEVRRVVVRQRPWDSAEGLVLAQSAPDLLDGRVQEAPPVGIHGDLQRRVGEDCRRPLDRVDLGDKRCVHQPSGLENPLVRPLLLVWVGLTQGVADGVVFAGEQRV